jgi:site-specific DNA-methyltransferase (adenine-specific)
MIDLRCGDCLELMKDIPDKSIDMILCDLPYGTTDCSWDEIIPFEPLWEQYNRIIKDNGTIVLFGSQPFTSSLIMSNIKNFKYEWIWEKQKASNFMSAKYQPLKYHENICVFSKSTHNYYPQKYKVLEFEEIKQMNDKELKQVFETRDYDRFGKVDRRKTINNPKTNKEHIGNEIIRIRNADDGYRYPKSVLKINKEINTNLHPTQKPVALLEYLIKTYTNENESVLDNCMGSGSTGVACVNTNRKFIGIELDEHYFEIAKERIENTKTQESLFNAKGVIIV